MSHNPDPQPGSSSIPNSSKISKFASASKEKFEVIKMRKYDPRTWKNKGESVKSVTQGNTPYPVLGMKRSDYEAESEILEAFKHELKPESEEQAAIFCCGGLIPMHPPVDIAWGSAEPSRVKKLTFPNHNNLRMLWNDCRSGFESISLTGESLRSADNLRDLYPEHFRTTFEPKNTGIIAAIRQIMLPSAAFTRYGDGGRNSRLDTMDASAVLHSLQVKKAPLLWHDST